MLGKSCWIKRPLWCALVATSLAMAACKSPESTAPGGNGPGEENVVPPTPPPGESRAGEIYSVYIEPDATGDTVAFTVFEPIELEGGQTYPLVLHGHGFQGQRYRSVPQSGVDPSNPAASDFTDIRLLRDNGYGIISIDQRAHGESTGDNRVMDPDFEGKNNLAILDWAEDNLDWLAYGPSVDGSDPHNLILGAVGGSYGSMYQRMLHNIDPKKRMDAMVPEIGPNNVVDSLNQNNVLKTGWNVGLFLVGSSTGAPTGSMFDPFVTREFTLSTTSNNMTQPLRDYLNYHSPSYFCEGQAVPTNGELNGAVLTPELPPTPAPMVHAWFWQGFRDTLFNFNDAYAGYQCLTGLGGDVRYSTYQRGHNTLQAVPDPGSVYQPGDNLIATDCGGTDVAHATLAFFDRYLKGIPDALDNFQEGVCLSLSSGDSVVVDTVTEGQNGTQFAIPETTVVAGTPNTPVIVDLGINIGAGGDIVGGMPWIQIEIESAAPLAGEPIIFAALGHIRANIPQTNAMPDIIDNQLTPFRGLGSHAVDMSGVAERLQEGDSIVLVFYGGHDQYAATGSISADVPSATVAPVTVSGNVWIPLLGPLPASQ